MIEGDGAGEQLVGRAHRGRAGSRSRRWPADRPARNAAADGAGRIGGVERIRHQDRRAGRLGRWPSARRRCAARNRPSREPLSTSTSVAGSIGRGSAKRRPSQAAAASQNASRPLFTGIAAELVDMGGQHRADERRHAVLRLADRQADGGLARRRIAQQLAQPHERRAHRCRPAAGEGGATAFGGGHEHRQKRRQHPPHKGSPTIGAARLRPV